MTLLFIISNDFGELSDTFYFVKGQNFTACLAVPPRLFNANQGKLPLKSYLYQSLQDIFNIVDRENPELIFLCSGYLYAINQILSLEAVGELLQTLKTKGHKLITSDPFLGILAELDYSTFNKKNPFHRFFLQHFAQLFNQLQDIPHLYTSPIIRSPKIQQISFFNHHMEISADERSTYPNILSQVLPIHLEKKRWLFLIGSEDYLTQVNRYGQQQFHELFYNKLEETIRSGRQAIVLAPQTCVEAVKRFNPSMQETIFLSFCPYQIFHTILLEAEYLFMWNIFSNCLISRIGNYGPVFFFAPGHLSQAIPAILELGMKCNYSYANLQYLDILKPLKITELLELCSVQEKVFEDTRFRYHQNPSPDVVVKQLLQ